MIFTYELKVLFTSDIICNSDQSIMTDSQRLEKIREILTPLRMKELRNNQNLVFRVFDSEMKYLLGEDKIYTRPRNGETTTMSDSERLHRIREKLMPICLYESKRSLSSIVYDGYDSGDDSENESNATS